MMEDLTTYDIKPEGFINYLRYYGEHFNKKLCKFACEEIGCSDYDKEKLDALLKQYNVELKDGKLYDAVYAANWLKSVLFGTGIPDEKRLVLGLKSLMEKESFLLFNRCYADLAKSGVPIEWEDMI